MFITSTKSGYKRGGEQFAHGLFLILMTDGSIPYPECRQSRDKVRGLVRHVRMWQSGNFMVAFVNIKAGGKVHKLHLSGAYGANGLTLDVPHEVFELGLDLPGELYQAWASGGGHNSTGSEAISMHKWARNNLQLLRNVKNRKS